jgi:hypothetical protein
MHDQQDRPNDPFQEARNNINMLIGLAQALSMPAHVWLTKFGTAGELSFGNRLGVIGWLILPVWPLCLMPCDPRPMYVFWLGTTALLFCHRIRHAMLRRRGYRPHSLFLGFSRLAWPGRYRSLGAREAAFTTGIGFILVGPWPALGWYLAWAGLAMVIAQGYAGEIQRSMLRRLNDAKRDQEWLAEQMRREE